MYVRNEAVLMVSHFFNVLWLLLASILTADQYEYAYTSHRYGVFDLVLLEWIRYVLAVARTRGQKLSPPCN